MKERSDGAVRRAAIQTTSLHLGNCDEAFCRRRLALRSSTLRDRSLVPLSGQSPQPRMRHCVRVKPERVAEVEFLEWTGADHLRHTGIVQIGDGAAYSGRCWW
jgi:ATP-dependent DNA ligase